MEPSAASDDEIDMNDVEALLALKKTRSIEELEAANARFKKARKRRKKANNITDDMIAPYGYVQVVNSDVRLTYPRVFMKVFNDARAEDFRKFVLDICDPDVHYKQEFDGASTPFGPKIFETDGTENLINVCVLQMTSCPDMFIEVDELKGIHCVHKQGTNEAYLTWNFIGSFTKLSRIVDADKPVSSPAHTLNLLLGTNVTKYMACNDDDDDDDDGDCTGPGYVTPLKAKVATIERDEVSAYRDRHIKFEDSLDSLTESFNNFKLEPMTVPVTRWSMKAQFCFIFNAQNKVKTIYRFFGAITEDTPNNNYNVNNTNSSVVSSCDDGSSSDNCGTVEDVDEGKSTVNNTG